MNKVFLAAALAVIGALTSLMAAPAARVTVDHSSREAIVDSFLKASAYEDGEALWQTILPVKVQTQQQLQIMKRSAVENYFKGFPASQRAELRKMINTPQWKNIVAEFLKELNPYIVKVNGKWYVDMWEMIRQEFKDVKIPPCPQRVDHSTRHSLILCFFLGIYYEKDELVWNSFSPDIQKAFAAQTGGKIPKGFAKVIKQNVPQNLLLIGIKTYASGEIKAEEVITPGVKFVKVNGKWYIAPAGR